MNFNFVVNNLSIERNQKIIINNFSLEISTPAIWALVGDNGSGKSSLLHSMAGLLPPQQGGILIDGHDIFIMQAHKRAQALTLLQQNSPTQSYCVAHSRIAHGLIPDVGFSWLDHKSHSLIKSVADKLAISHLLGRSLGTLSGGEQRLVHIAKTLVSPHRLLLLLDEPTAFLDFTQKSRLAEILNQRAQQCLVIFSSHDLDFILTIAKQILHINHSYIEILSPAQLFSSFGSRSKKAETSTVGESPS